MLDRYCFDKKMDSILETEESLGDSHDYSGEEATIYTQMDLAVKDPRIKGCEDVGGPGFYPKLTHTKKLDMGQEVP